MQFVSAGFILPPAVDVNFPSPINRHYFVSGIQPVLIFMTSRNAVANLL